MRAAHGGDAALVAARGEPVEQLGADCATFRAAVGGVHRTLAPRDDKHYARTHGAGLVEPAHDAIVSAIERMPMQVERVIGRDLASLELAVPASVQALLFTDRCRGGRCRPGPDGRAILGRRSECRLGLRLNR